MPPAAGLGRQTHLKGSGIALGAALYELYEECAALTRKISFGL